MPSFTTCLRQAAQYLPPEQVAAMTRRAAELRAEGVEGMEAARRAVQETHTERKGKLAEIEQAMKDGATLYEAEPPATEAGKAEAAAAPTRMDALVQERPDMLVQLDGMDQPMRLADFVAAVKAEADEMAADAPLFQVAAECALLNGL